MWRFQNYRDCGYTCNPHKFEIPALRFPCRVPVNPCKHLQCSYNSLDPITMYHPGQRSNLNNSITLDSLKAQGQSSIHFLFPTLSDKLLSYFLQVSLGLSSHNHHKQVLSKLKWIWNFFCFWPDWAIRALLKITWSSCPWFWEFWQIFRFHLR